MKNSTSQHFTFNLKMISNSIQLLLTLLISFLSINYSNAQTLTTEKAFASGCYYYGGNSKTTISVQVGWTNAINGDLIKVVLDGSTTRTIKPESFYDPGTGSAIAGPMVTPQVVAFEINADGISHKIEADLFSSTNVLKASAVDKFVTSPSPCAPIACSGTSLGGMVYFDNNADGIHDAGETQGIDNALITAFDKNGNVYTATSDGYGRYAFSTIIGNNIPAANFPVRLEFTNWPVNVSANSGPSITGNKSSVRFVAAAACNIDCGGVYPLNYSQSNPKIFNNIYTNGDPLAGGSAGNEPGLISHDYNSNTDYSITVLAQQKLIGSVWGKAWNKFEKKLVVSSFLKRHSGMGPLGPGGLYLLNYTNPGSPVFTNLIDVTTIGINVGQASIPSNAARGLLANKDTPNKDGAVFGLIGKAGIGSIDLSEDGNMLFLMNLFDRKIYSIDFTNYWNTGTLPTAANVVSFAIPDPGCVGGDFRPFAVKVYNGNLYVGLVCDGSTGTKSNMVAYVKGRDLVTNTWFDVFDFPLTYPKGYPDQTDGSKVGWYKWSDVISDIWSGSGAILHPVPILSDIEFDLDGTMVIALMDRTPQQMGHENFDNTALNDGAFIAAGGDYLRAFYSNGAYVLENAAKAGPNVGFYPTNNQGPGFGEFYNDNIDGGVKYHTEMGTGGLVLVPGSGEVLAGMVDPNYFSGGPLYANGVRRMSNTTGNHTGGFSYISGATVDNFAKGIGIGDMEAATNDLTYLELGNYVWRDVDGDGIQDPAEIGVKDIILKLYKSSDGSLIATATTDANGNYYFSTLSGHTILPNTDYCILAGVGQFVGGSITLAGVTYSMTAYNTGQGTDPDLNDNDFSFTNISTLLGARPAGFPQFCVKTGEYGYINHTIDMGLIPCSITGSATPSACNDNGTPYLTSDDYFQVTVSSTNGAAGPSNQYEVVYNNVVIGTGTYGSSITIGTSITPPFKPDGISTYDLFIRDKDHKDCITGVIKVGPVTPCPKYYDFGDLPDTNGGLPNSYPTTKTNGGEGIGASHLIITGLKMGNTIDSESDGQPNAGATGDGNDEDGVVLPMFIAGQTATVPVTVMNTTGATAKLTMFIDFNKNGNLDEASEMASANVVTGTNGVVNLSIAVPVNAVANQNLGIRFRLTTDATISMKSTGEAPDGEVEDYIVQIMAYDYGDLPDTDNGTGSYPTNVTNGGEGIGASHKIITGLKIGATIDAEGDGQPNITATGDGNDEDGVTLPMLIAGKTATIPVTVMNTTGSTAKLTMFIDFNLDHDFNDAGEMVSANVVTGTNGVVNLSLPVPADAILNKELGVRFRLSTNATQSMSPTGAAIDGEVEDYLTTIMGYDYGDLLDLNNGSGSYPTNLTNGGEGVGPSHKIIDGLKIGNTIDAEGDGQSSTLADGDDNNGTSPDDEDGVTLPAFNTGNTATIPVKVMNLTTSTAKLTMFIDFNNNKSLADAGEMTSINVPPGTNSTLNLSILVPVNAATNTNLGVRFRLSTDATISMLPTGAAPDGEVEDYVTSITGSKLTHNKSIKKVTSTGLNTYLVEYTINVINNGTGSGTYKLEDRTAFDNDIDITSASYTSNAPGNLGPINLVGSGIWTLAGSQVINANTTHTYTVGVNVKIDLIDGVKGDDKYFACGKAIVNSPSSGEGLFNESILDIYADGSVDEKDTACADLPFIIHDKSLIGVTPTGINTYDVVYAIDVTNIGGATGQYDLRDEPKFDDDITQVSAKYLSSITGLTTALGVPGPWILANNQNIVAGATQKYTLTVGVKIDLEDGVVGDDKYTACQTGTPGFPKENEGLFNRSLLDVNDDGKYDYRDSVCTDIPYIVHEKLIDNVVSTGINKYKIIYKIVVKNIGGAAGSYNLSDAPGFDDDITITASQYSSNATSNPGNPGPLNLAGSGPWTLATNQNISPSVTQTFTIPVDVTVSLEAGSGGDNVLKYCGQTIPGIPRVGEGLFNRSLLDLDKNGLPDKQDSVCYDLPYIIHDKEIVSVIPTGANKYTVNYKITVKNIGAVAGTYGLADAPKFDNDIDIVSSSYTSNAPGFVGPTNLAGNGPWTLSSNVNLGAAGTHTYNLAVNVKIDLIDGVSGDDVYFACGRSSSTHFTAGEGLFNESRLDLNNDGVADMRDTVCADLPFIIHDKTIIGVTPVGINNYDVVYGIDVKNIGGATGQYDLEDEPAFDDDITQTSAKYLSSVTGLTTALVIPGPWKLANNQNITAGSIQKYTLTVRVKIDLEDGVVGDDHYTACESGTPGFPKDNEGLFNRSLLDVNDDGKADYRDSVCADLPYIVHEKLIDNVVPTGINKYKITYKIIVKNIGGALGSYNLSDAPGFDDDITILGSQYSTNASGNLGNPGPKVLALVGPWTLATNQNINANEIQTYTIPVDVSVSLEAGSGGDNILRSCGATVPGVPRVGEGLFNRSLLDLDKNGTPDRQDSVCYDLPYIIHEKEIVSVVPTGANQYTVNYKITVKNIGTVNGIYGLADAPKFDNDIDIVSSSYTSNAPGFTGPSNLVGSGPWTLSTLVNLAAGGIHTYNLAVKVKIDLIDGVSGDDIYYACGRSSSTNYTAGEGLFNESRLDLNNDGLADMRDTVCADLPFIIHDKTIIGVTPTGVNTYDVVYAIDVKNIGGAIGQYDLKDEPKFDNDIAQVSAKYLSSVTGLTNSLPVPGPWILANNQSITAGATQKYTLTVGVKIDLEDGVTGDDKYTACQAGTPGFPKENEGLFNRSLLDVNHDGTYDYRDSVCTDIPYIVHEKLIDNVVSTGINKYKITYKIVVKNIGGALGSYNLSDAPGFDDDITILGSQYSTNASGNLGNPGPKVLALVGPWTLATNQNINANEIQTYTIPVDVSVSLEAGSGGDNILRSCGATVPGVPRVGEGLFNRSLLDLDKNGTPDRQDSVCYDLPYIVHEKLYVGTSQTGARTFKVDYKIVVKNLGTAAGTYGLADAPKFDNDIDIQSAKYTSNAPGFFGPTNLAGFGPWTLSTNAPIPAGGVHTYDLSVDVKFDLSTSTGDKVYYQCGRSNPNILTAGEGLFNESRLDLNNDGIADFRDTVCADLPYVEHEKFITSVTKTGLGLYTVKYKIEVKNRGGATGKYDLSDNPGLDDDFEVLSAKYSSDAVGNPGTPGPLTISNSGPWLLANDQNINPGSLQTYNLSLDLKIDLQTVSSAGDEIYHYCGTTIPGIPSKGEGLFNESTLDVNNDGNPDQRDTVCQDVEIVDLALRKKVVTLAPYAYGQNITFSIDVINQGNVTMNQVEIADYIPKGYSLAAGNVGWTGVSPLVKKVIAGPLKPGNTLTTNIILKLEQTQGGRMDWINYAEISKSINSRNEDVSLDDEDSKPSSDGPLERTVKPGDPKDDDIFSRDKFGEEDDHDPAGIEVFDLALRKVYKGNYPIHYNDIVPFEITVFNQGNTTAKEIQVVDYVPVGYDWVSAGNAIWTYNTITRMATSTYAGFLKPGDSTKLTINLKVLPNYTGIKAWDNLSEIKIVKDSLGNTRTKDIDSEFDMDPNNDMGGIPDTKTDNHINDDGNDGDLNGIKDHDDHDPARPVIIDLALRKWVLNKKPYYVPGETVPYTITVFNQGNAIMNSVTVNDYLFNGYTFNPAINSGWSLVGTTLTKTQSAILNPGDSMQFQLNLIVSVPVGATVESWWNYAEIKGSKDINEIVRDLDDADSKSNSDTPYERSVKPEDPWDNVIDGQGSSEGEDEDDHDPEKVIVTAWLGDFVWKDTDGNGIQNPGEPGIKDVIVSLYKCDGSLVKKDTTDNIGNYSFDFLVSGDYFLKFDYSQTPYNSNYGWTFSDRGGDDRKDSDANSAGISPCTHLDWGERDSTWDAGLVELATYGDYVWHDKDGDGMQEPGEEGVSGVQVTLYDAATNLPVKSTTTDANGLYLFKYLMPMTYYAKFTPPAGWNITDPDLGPDFKDSDVNNSNGVGTTATTLLSPGEDDRTWDLGLWKCSSIGGRVFFDVDLDGIFDQIENGINGLEVYLVDAMTGITVAKTKTQVTPGTPSDDGYYKFTCVKPGMYYVRFERPGHLASSAAYMGGNSDKDSDISHENGVNTTRKYTIVSDNMLLNIGAGFQLKATVGDYVWIDANYNGLQDSGEQPISGVKVYAYRTDGTMVSESKTEVNGHYMLDGIAQGDYYVKFDAPSGYSYTSPHTGNDAIDSDADGTNGFGTTRTYRINTGDDRPSIDAGLVFQVLPLEWLSFEGRYNGSFTELDWKTGIELNNDHFEVERRYESEASFSVIAKVDASADANQKLHQYNHDDYDVNKSGLYFYRIKQVDRDGISSYSKTISIRVNSRKELSLNIYPNPTDESLFIEIGIAEDSELEVRVFDEAGKNILTNPFSGFRKAGYYKESLNTGLFVPGQYNLQIKTSTGIINKRFTVSR
ncbi:MAG: SdrD B-like domain-containing protein [Saprospiraceae bacterium]